MSNFRVLTDQAPNQSESSLSSDTDRNDQFVQHHSNITYSDESHSSGDNSRSKSELLPGSGELPTDNIPGIEVEQPSSPEHSRHIYQYENPQHSSIPSNLSSILPHSTSQYTHDKYTRYPHSRVVSGTVSLNSNSNLLQDYNSKGKDRTSSTPNSQTPSDTDSNPFLIDADFSPFGGFPAKQFPLFMEEKESDDELHNPGTAKDKQYEKNRFYQDFKSMDKRYFGGLFGLLLLFIGAIVVFIVLPVITYSGVTTHYGTKGDQSSNQIVETLSYYEYPTLGAIRTSLIDPDTPKAAYTKVTHTGETWKLVFSDEFNAEGRTFYPGDDQFWTAPDLHYDATKDLEWYDPDAATTSEGTLVFTMDAFQNHNLFYRSGMLQSWNKMCFTQGKLEASARLPNYGNVTGLWPGIWTLGNLARPGYLATSEGVWPYSYEACDAGITANQSATDGISYLKGQRLSVCTCDGEDHPNQGTGRGAPEIDALEGAVDTKINVGVASQSYQVAPYDIWYIPDYDYIEIYNHSITAMNTYCGGPFQQALSAVTTLNTSWYQVGGTAEHRFQTYGFEYENDNDNGYCTWFAGSSATHTIYAQALHPNGNVDWRRISKEPMSIILNLGVSNNWAYIDWPSILFPATMQIDYVRVYQPPGNISVTCDPKDFPTYNYIEAHKNAYSNANLTRWEDAGYSYPKNILTGQCSSSKFKLSSS